MVYQEKFTGMFQKLFPSWIEQNPWRRLLWNLLGALTGGLLTAFSVTLITANDFAAFAVLVSEHITAVFWSMLFFAVLSLTIGLTLKRLCWGYLLVSLVGIGFTIINHYKMLITAVPLELHEVALANRLGAITALNAASIRVTVPIVTAILIILVWFIVLLVFTRPALNMTWKYSLSAAAGALMTFLLLFVVLIDPLVYVPAGVSLENRTPQIKVYNECFVPLGLWRSVLFQDNLELIDVNDEDAMKDLMDSLQGSLGNTSGAGSAPETPAPPETPVPPETQAPPETPVQPETPVPPETPVQPETPVLPETPVQPEVPVQTQPNIILVLAESFFDVTDLRGVTYEKDPLAEFHALQSQAVSGRFFSRTLGYGTCNIELEVFTGIHSALLEKGDDPLHWDPADVSVFPTVPEILQDNGYYTGLVHMFNDSIYNRKELFSRMGFKDMYFSEAFAAIDPDAAAAAESYWQYLSPKISGDYYGDDYMSDLIIDMYEKEGVNGPVFLYASSMENHTPYTADKYSKYDYPFKTDVPLSDQATGVLNAYTQGAASGSKALQKLVDYFSQVEEPTIILFFGDHPPGLGLDSGSVYTKLGIFNGDVYSVSPDEGADLFASDYLIWANDPALLPAKAGTKRDTSCGFFGLDVLNAADVALPRYWQMVQNMYQQSQCYNDVYFVGQDGKIYWTHQIPESVDTTPFVQMASILADARGKRSLTDWLCQVP